MAEISQPAIPAADGATSLHSEFSEIAASSADLDSVAKSAVSVDLSMASSPSLSSSHLPVVYNTSSSVNDGVPSLPCQQLPSAASVVVTSGSPATLAASCSSTPPTPQSHASDNSPGVQCDRAVTVPPPPYPAAGAGLTTDLTTAVTVSTTDSLTQLDTARSHFPPPPKKPLTPYMRFSKSVSNIDFILLC